MMKSTRTTETEWTDDDENLAHVFVSWSISEKSDAVQSAAFLAK